MSATRIDRRILSKANPINVIRLAKYIGIQTSDDIPKLIEAIAKELNVEDKWPPTHLERKW